jgi:hypothetical protein
MQHPEDAQIPALRTAAPHKKDTEQQAGVFRRSADDSVSGLSLIQLYSYTVHINERLLASSELYRSGAWEHGAGAR